MKKILLIFFTLPVFIHAQQNKDQPPPLKKIDALKNTLDLSKKDTVTAFLINDICWEYAQSGELDSAMTYGKLALSFSETQAAKSSHPLIKNGFTQSIARAYNNIGN